MKNYLSLTFIFVFMFLSWFGFSQNNEILLWKNIPGEIVSKDYKEELKLDNDGNVSGVNKVAVPTLTIFLADKNTNSGTSVIICPGGGYGHLAINKEGYKVAKWLNSIGISAFVLKYRLPSDLIMKDQSIGPLQDVQETVRTLRRNAEKWNIDPSKIGVMGFSAGGHLASTAATHYDDKVYEVTDNTSARPDFSILIYPVISMQEGITHMGSRNNLLGEKATFENIEKYSNEKHVNAKTPKTFLVHAGDDTVVPVENSINYYLALKQNQVPAEMHIYEKGGHGFGLGVEGTTKYWTIDCENWLIANEYILKNK